MQQITIHLVCRCRDITAMLQAAAKKIKNTYWNNVNKGFTKEVERYFNDRTEHL